MSQIIKISICAVVVASLLLFASGLDLNGDGVADWLQVVAFLSRSPFQALLYCAGMVTLPITNGTSELRPPEGWEMARRRYQKGSLALEGNRWVLRWREDEVNADGGIKRVLRYQTIGTIDELPTQRIAQRQAEQIISKVNALTAQPGRTIRFADFVVRWKANVLPGRKPSVQRQKLGHLNRYLLPEFGEMTLMRINQEQVQAMVSKLAPRMKRHSILNVVGTLSGILRTARKWGYVVGPFMRADLDIPTDTKPVMRRRFTPEQVRSIIDAAEGKTRAMLATIAMTGMRPGELLSLTVENLDFDARLINVTHTVYKGQLLSPKSSASAAAVPMPEPLAELLLAYLEQWEPNPLGLLFPNALGRPFNLTRFTVKRLWPLLDRLNMPRGGMHAFRRTLATHMLASGASPKDVQKQLRHEDVRTTLRIYTESVGDAQRKAAEKVAAILYGSVRKPSRSAVNF